MTTPRVSDVLRLMDDSYEQVPEELLALAAERGRLLHELVLSHFAASLGHCPDPKLEEIPAEYRQCYEGALDWGRNNAIEPILVEQRSTNLCHDYTGQPDLFAHKGPKRTKTLFDTKFTAMILPINRVQLRAYKELPLYAEAEAMEIVKINWATGQVKSERVHENGTGDWPAFLIALRKLRALEEVEHFEKQLAIWRGTA